MYGVAPHTCGQVVRPLLGGEAEGRSLGFIYEFGIILAVRPKARP